MKKSLNGITLLGADCVHLEKLIKAADQCEKFFSFESVKLLSSMPSEDERVIKIPHISDKKSYDKFMMESLNDYVDTNYALVIQHDGFILNPNAWDEEYRKYDYIGAPWGYGELAGKIGNGGFSLRSKKLIKECAEATFPRLYGGIENQEDVQIGHTHKEYFKSKGIKFAPVSLAQKFSIEGNPENSRTWTHQFGFHDFKQTDTQSFIPSQSDVDFHCYYKYSDKGKAPAVDKRTVFKNFIEVFGAQNLSILLDNSEKESKEFFKEYCPQNLWETNLGNCKANIFLYEKALELNDDSIVYFCEDDYLHFKFAKQLIFEGLTLADYVTLYDHGDKYLNDGPNPYVKDGGEDTKVLITPSTHWKHTNSTTMTFASKARTIKKDFDILKEYCTRENDIPDDFNMFLKLSEKKRTLISSIPGRSTHLCPNGLFSPLINWDAVINPQ